MCTIADNKLIAEFMGYKQSTSKEAGANLVNNVYEWYLKDVGYYYINDDYHAEDYLLFHLDWNWLMKVVEKINGLNNVVSINENHVLITNNERSEKIVEVVAGEMLEATYKAVIEFIKYYNNEK
jgi:hypothetical protein